MKVGSRVWTDVGAVVEISDRFAVSLKQAVEVEIIDLAAPESSIWSHQRRVNRPVSNPGSVRRSPAGAQFICYGRDQQGCGRFHQLELNGCVKRGSCGWRRT